MAINETDRTDAQASRTGRHPLYSFGIASFFSEENFSSLESIMYPKKAREGTHLFWEGDEARQLYFLKSGRVKTTKATEDGQQLLLSIMQRGDLLGEVDAYGDMLHTFSAEVIEDAEIGAIQWKDLEVLLYQHGEFAIEFTKWMGLQQRMAQSKLRDLLLYGKPGALASTLIRMSNSFGVKTEEGIRLDLKLNNSEMAEMIGATRESVNRMLNGYKKDGTIEMENGTIIIKRLDKLRCVCNCPQYPACPAEICRL